jgi:DNA sulfur modification protein DndB
MNNGVQAFLGVLSDMVDNVKASEGLSPLEASTEDLLSACQQYLDPLVDYLDGLSLEEGAAYRKLYGSGAGLRYYRKLQEALRTARPSFEAPGLDDWLKAQDKQFTNEALGIVHELEAFFKADIKQQLENEYGSAWEREGVPRPVRKDIQDSATEKNLDAGPGDEVSPWDMMYIIDYHKVLISSHELWEKRFSKRYTRPADEDLAGSWKGRLGWMKTLNPVRNDVMHGRPITEENYAFLVELRDWLLAPGSDAE